MSDKIELGRRGEAIAAAYLEEKGYVILERNFRFQRSEIDIIANFEGTTIFIEVKTRVTERYGQPEESVTIHKEKMMALGAEGYIEKHEIETDIRYDIISVILNAGIQTVTHIEDAFWPVN